jgi:uncharacterized RDD family membrane protein YckC
MGGKMNQTESNMPEVGAGEAVIKMEGPIIGGFWRRLGAFVLDMLVLGILGQILGYFFFDQLAAMGAWGRLLGWIIAVSYFGIMNSRLVHGQTIGKRLLGIIVVDSAGNFIAVSKSLFRSAILFTPIFLNGAAIPNDRMSTFFNYILGFVVFGGLGSIIYLFIFNRKTRQNIHDIVVHTYVIKRSTSQIPVRRKTWTVHYAICGLLCIVVLVLSYLVMGFSKSDTLKGVFETRSEIVQETGISNVSLMVGTTSFISKDKRTVQTYAFSQVVVSKKPVDSDALAAKVAAIILHSYPPAMKKDVIRVVVTYGFDIGIAKRHSSYSEAYAPTQWLEQLSRTDSTDKNPGEKNPSVKGSPSNSSDTIPNH